MIAHGQFATRISIADLTLKRHNAMWTTDIYSTTLIRIFRVEAHQGGGSLAHLIDGTLELFPANQSDQDRD